MSIMSWLAKRRLKKAFRSGAPGDMSAADRMAHFQATLNKLASKGGHLSPKKVGIEGSELGGQPGEWVWDREVLPGLKPDYGMDGDTVILMLHGGGYMWGTPAHFRDTAWRLSRAAKARVFVLDYPLSTAAPFPAQLASARAAYDAILERGAKSFDLAVIGDSAGGHLALSLVQSLVADGAQVPCVLGLISPWLDLTGSGDSMTINDASDVMIDPTQIEAAGKVFAGDVPLDDPRVSPLFGPMAGLPPTLIQVSSNEVLLSDSVRAAERMLAADVDVVLDVWPGMFHDWQQLGRMVPEARTAIQQFGDFFISNWQHCEP